MLWDRGSKELVLGFHTRMSVLSSGQNAHIAMDFVLEEKEDSFGTRTML